MASSSGWTPCIAWTRRASTPTPCRSAPRASFCSTHPERVRRAAARGRLRAVLGLPDGITACLFDLDGVLTTTAELHARAWKQMFDAFLAERGEPPFALPRDYEEYVDGKPRLDGVRSFLQSRGI